MENTVQHSLSRAIFFEHFLQPPESDRPSTSIDSEQELPDRDLGNFPMSRPPVATLRFSAPRPMSLNDNHDSFVQLSESDRPSTSIDSEQELPDRDLGNFPMSRRPGATRRFSASRPMSLNDNHDSFVQPPESDRPYTSIDSEQELPDRDLGNFSMSRRPVATRRFSESTPRPMSLNDNRDSFVQPPESDRPYTSIDSEQELPDRDLGNFPMSRRPGATRRFSESTPRPMSLNDNRDSFVQPPESDRPYTSIDSEQELPDRDLGNFSMSRRPGATRRFSESTPRPMSLNDNRDSFVQPPESDRPYTSIDSEQELPDRDLGNFSMSRRPVATRRFSESTPRPMSLNDNRGSFVQPPESDRHPHRQ